MSLDLNSLQKAIASLSEVTAVSKHMPAGISNEIVRDSVIKRYEYTYELCWKMLQRWIKINISPTDAEPRTRKDLFRLAAQKGLINDPERWFEFNDARNESAHAYDEEKADLVYKVALKFETEAKSLLKALEKHND